MIDFTSAAVFATSASFRTRSASCDFWADTADPAAVSAFAMSGSLTDDSCEAYPYPTPAAPRSSPAAAAAAHGFFARIIRSMRISCGSRFVWRRARPSPWRARPTATGNVNKFS